MIFHSQKDIWEKVKLYGEKCVCYMYIAVDGGVSNNTSEDSHKIYWIPIDEVEEKLTYSSLKEAWRCNREKIEKIVN